jgi:hypothetical protein
MLIVGLPENKVPVDACFLLSIELTDGFKFKIPARGYNLKSWIDFEKSLSITKKVTIKEVTFSEYKKHNPWAYR